MDKRSILFILCVSTAYFCVHAFFGTQQNQTIADKETKIAIERQEKFERLEKERLSRTALLSDLPVIDLFTDKSEKAATALQIDDLFLTLAWKNTLPAILFAEGDALTLAAQGRQGDPILYQKPNAKQIELPALRTDQFTEVQLLCLSDLKIY